MKWILKIQRIMYGRYGIDELYKFLLWIYLILFILNIFVKNSIITIIEIVVFVIMFYRVLSKNITMRRKENSIYLKIKSVITSPFKTIIKNIKDREHIYKKCRKCGKTLRLPLPSERGIKKVKCPKCGNRLKVLCLKYEKVEIIKKR